MNSDQLLSTAGSNRTELCGNAHASNERLPAVINNSEHSTHMQPHHVGARGANRGGEGFTSRARWFGHEPVMHSGIDLAQHAHRDHRANDRALIAALKLRYQVYCLECKFLCPDDYPDGVETDEHDEHAAHFYSFDAHDELVGYVRLIHADADQCFPIQKHCATSADRVTLPAPNQAAEISRLMVRSDYRRRRGDLVSGVTAKPNHAHIAGERRHDSPQILLSLYRQMYAYSRKNGIRHWYAAMERPLARSLLRLNFAFKAIGPQTDYYGPVVPYLADIRELEAQVGARHPGLLSWLRMPERRMLRNQPTNESTGDLISNEVQPGVARP